VRPGTLGHLSGPFPRILGHEPVGEIVAVAPDVTARQVGDRVGTARIQSTCGRYEWCQRGRRMFCPDLKGTGIEAEGGHAEYMMMNADAPYLAPDKGVLLARPELILEIPANMKAFSSTALAA
jgi:alcohol dehydrogenase